MGVRATKVSWQICILKEDPMDPKRQGEIALKLVKQLMRKRGIQLSQDNMREFGNIAKAIEVPVELKQFAKPLMQNSSASASPPSSSRETRVELLVP